VRPPADNPAAQAGNALPSTIGGRYRIERLLGRGGCGKVFLAQHANTGERVALKLLTGGTRQQEFVERFKREMRVPAQLRSEHVVRVLDADISPELNGAPFFVMERLVGSDLQKFLTRYGALSREETVWILGQVGKALQRAHQIGLVHRDLKPENIFLHLRPDAPPIVKILDFGLVHLMRSPEASPAQPDGKLREHNHEHIGDARMTRAGTIIGTPMYMAPELVEGAVDRTGPATDIWALGLIAFELLTGISFWIPAPVPMLLGRILDGPMPSPTSRSRKVPQGFVPWFTRSCARDAKGRWPTVNEQLDELAKALGVPPSLLAQADPPPSLLDRVDALMASLSGSGMQPADLPSRPAIGNGKVTEIKTAVIGRRLKRFTSQGGMNRWLIATTTAAVVLWTLVLVLRACGSRPAQPVLATPPRVPPILTPLPPRPPDAPLKALIPPTPTPRPVTPSVPPDPPADPPERRHKAKPEGDTRPTGKRRRGDYMPIAP
jgi:serine/threonine protein kinase